MSFEYAGNPNSSRGVLSHKNCGGTKDSNPTPRENIKRSKLFAVYYWTQCDKQDKIYTSKLFGVDKWTPNASDTPKTSKAERVYTSKLFGVDNWTPKTEKVSVSQHTADSDDSRRFYSEIFGYPRYLLIRSRISMIFFLLRVIVSISCFKGSDPRLEALKNVNNDYYDILDKRFENVYTVIARSVYNKARVVSYLSFSMHRYCVTENNRRVDLVRMESSCTDRAHRNRGLSIVLRIVPILFARINRYDLVGADVVEESQQLLVEKCGMRLTGNNWFRNRERTTMNFNVVLDLKQDDLATTSNNTTENAFSDS